MPSKIQHIHTQKKKSPSQRDCILRTKPLCSRQVQRHATTKQDGTNHYDMPSISLNFLDFEVYRVCNKEQTLPLQINAVSNIKEHHSPTGRFILLFSETFQLSMTNITKCHMLFILDNFFLYLKRTCR